MKIGASVTLPRRRSRPARAGHYIRLLLLPAALMPRVRQIGGPVDRKPTTDFQDCRAVDSVVERDAVSMKDHGIDRVDVWKEIEIGNRDVDIALSFQRTKSQAIHIRADTRHLRAIHHVKRKVEHRL